MFTDFKFFSLTDLNLSYFFLLTTPSRLKFAATLPSNLSLIACFVTLLFHKLVWQRTQRSGGILITNLLQIYPGIFSEKQL